MKANSLLMIKSLKTYYYTPIGLIKAVDGIDLEISRGEFVAIVGESGCGKSTAALSILRLVPPPGQIIEGHIVYEQKDLLGLTTRELREIRGKHISMIFQNPVMYLNPIMKVGEQVNEAIRLNQKVDRKGGKKKTIETLRQVRIPAPEKVYESYPHQLSGGMQQRVLIAAAISCHPSLLIADEPTTSLDVTVQSQIVDLLKKVIGKLGGSLLLITHDLGVVADIADSVYVMYLGRVVEHSDIFSLFENPKHPYTQGLLKSAFSLDKFKKKLEAIEGEIPDPVNPPSGCRFHPRCKKAMDICRRREPPYVKVGDGLVSCWLYD